MEENILVQVIKLRLSGTNNFFIIFPMCRRGIIWRKYSSFGSLKKHLYFNLRPSFFFAFTYISCHFRQQHILALSLLLFSAVCIFPFQFQPSASGNFLNIKTKRKSFVHNFHTKTTKPWKAWERGWLGNLLKFSWWKNVKLSINANQS